MVSFVGILPEGCVKGRHCEMGGLLSKRAFGESYQELTFGCDLQAAVWLLCLLRGCVSLRLPLAAWPNKMDARVAMPGSSLAQLSTIEVSLNCPIH